MSQTGAYHQLSPEAQAWVRAQIVRHGLPFDPIAEVLAEAVQYGAGQDVERPSLEEWRRRRETSTHRGS